MKRILRHLLGWGLMTVAATWVVSTAQADDVRWGSLSWSELPAFPQPVGGAFAGVSDGALVVAGGAHFPTPLFEGGSKQWVSAVYALRPEGGRWQQIGDLPAPRAYGAAVTLDEGVLLIGGGDPETHTRQVTLLSLDGDALQLEEWPPLPEPNAFHGAARLGDSIYVAGGRAAPDAPRARQAFWRLDLSDRAAGWKEMPSWDGPARLLPVVAAQDGRVIVCSGAELVANADGAGQRRYLRDTHLFYPDRGWEPGAALPHPVVAAPAAELGSSHVLVFGGDDGSLADRVQELADNHPGFSRTVLAYHTITDAWAPLAEMPATPVTTNAVSWQGGIVIPTGEHRPGHRTASVLKAVPEASHAVFKRLDYVLLVIYLGALVAMGVYFSRREKTTHDFFLGGQRVPWWAAGMSIFGTQLSAITFMAIPAKSFATDWTFILVNACIVLITPAVVWFYLPFFRGLNITTAYEYLERRFNLWLRLFGSLSFLLFQLGRMGIVLFLPAIALSTVTGLDIYLCIVVMGVLCTVYTVLGGIEAVIWTDVLQVIVLIGGALLSLLIIVTDIDGGFGRLLELGQADEKFHTFTWSWDYTLTAVWVVVIGNLLAQLVPYTTDQTVIQRYLTTKDQRAAAQAIWTNAALTIPAAFIFFGVGTALYVFYKVNPADLHPLLQNDAIFPWFVAQQLPAGISGIVIAGLFAAAMSSLDSSMNSVSAVITTDYHSRLGSQHTSERSRLFMARVITVILGVIATATAAAMAGSEIKSLWDLFLKILGLFGGSVAGIFALGIFTTRANSAGALGGALAGVVAVWSAQRTDIHFFLYAGIGIVVTFAVGYLLSLVLPARKQDLAGITMHTRTADQPSLAAGGQEP
jgi:solute:Na+ symporter, SSS family